MFWIIVILCVCVDQLSKLRIAQTMELGSSHAVIPGVLDLTYTHNTGAAFSILTGQQTLLIVVTAASAATANAAIHANFECFIGKFSCER